MTSFVWSLIHNTLLLYCIISVSSYQHCLTPYQCTNQTLNDSTVTLSDGYKAAFGPLTSWSGGKIQCTASFSCSSMQFMNAHATDSGGTIHCKAKDSCSNTVITSNNSRIECYGSDSCRFSTITTTYNSLLKCSGYRSCSSAHIRGVELIQAGAALSLFNSTIDSIGSVGNTMRVINEGHLAGFGAKLLCRENHTCYIDCRGFNSCYMFYTQCIGECRVNASTSSSAPITNITQFNTFKPYTIPVYAKWFESEAVQPSNDELCTRQKWNFDASEAHNSTSDITVNNRGPMCCRGYRSCYGIIGAIRLQNQTDNALMCDGFEACRSSAIISNNGTIYCGGKWACYLRSISDAHDVYCGGRNACSSSSITNVSYVVCNGQKSCYDSTFSTTGFDMNIYFVGKLSGNSATLYCNETGSCNVYCYGQDSCDGTVLYCNQNCDVECDATDSKCPIVHGSKPPTMYPSLIPSVAPTRPPSDTPSSIPSVSPTRPPSDEPSLIPSVPPTRAPSDEPSLIPSVSPTRPTSLPSGEPSLIPSVAPTSHPSLIPSVAPSNEPSDLPSNEPSVDPTKDPISNAVTTNYEVKIDINCEDTDGVDNAAESTDCDIDPDVLNDVIETVLSVDANVEIVSTEIVNDDLVIHLSVTTGPHNILKKDTITDHIEAEIEDNDDFGDVETEEKDANFNDFTQDDALVDYIKVVLISAGFITLICVLCCIASFIIKTQKNKTQLVQMTGANLDVGPIDGDTISPGTTTEPDVTTNNDMDKYLEECKDEIDVQQANSSDKALDVLDESSTESDDEDELMYDNANNDQTEGEVLSTPHGTTQGVSSIQDYVMQTPSGETPDDTMPVDAKGDEHNIEQDKKDTDGGEAGGF